jgi:hypothetical protein
MSLLSLVYSLLLMTSQHDTIVLDEHFVDSLAEREGLPPAIPKGEGLLLLGICRQIFNRL